MKFIMKFSATTLLLLASITALAYFLWYKPKFEKKSKPNSFSFKEKESKDNSETLLRLYQKSLHARHYNNAHGFNQQYCFLLDMRLPSGKNRFFVYNLNKDSVEFAGLVTHGGGSDNGSDELTFSNTPNSHCTSVGKYKMGKSYNGKFGLAYKLYGLDKSNSKAFDRFVVLHAHGCVPNEEVAPVPICVSQGCPTVSPAFLSTLKNYIDRSDKPILLWIYY